MSKTRARQFGSRGGWVVACSAVLAACGARTDLTLSGTGGGTSSATVGSTTSSVSVSASSSTGGIPPCDAPGDGKLVLGGFEGALDLTVDGHTAYVLMPQDVFAVDLCGGPKRLVSHTEPTNAGSLSVIGSLLYWGGNAAGSQLYEATSDGGGTLPTPLGDSHIIGMTADADGQYVAKEDGSMVGRSPAFGIIPLAAKKGPITASAPLYVDQGWVYFAFSTGSDLNGTMGVVRTDGNLGFGIDPMTLPVPTDFAVDHGEIFMVRQSSSELTFLDVKGSPQVTTLAIVPAPVGIVVDATYLYIADEKGIERAHRDGSLVELLWPEKSARFVAQSTDAVVWLAADGNLSWRKKPK